MPLGNNDISMQEIAASGSLDASNISLQTIYTSFINSDASGDFALDDMGNKGYPTVTTNAASSVTQTSMTCNGNVSGYGNITIGLQRGFYFGTNSNYASNTKVTAAGTGTGAYTLSRTSLTAGTTYYITAYALNAFGETQGSTVSQATSSPSLTSFSALLDAEGSTFGSGNAACAAEEVTVETWYHDGTGTFPEQTGDNVYTNSGGTTNAPDGYFRVDAGRSNKAISLENGQTNDSGLC